MFIKAYNFKILRDFFGIHALHTQIGHFNSCVVTGVAGGYKMFTQLHVSQVESLGYWTKRTR